MKRSSLYKKVIQVDFICSYYQRLAHLAYDSDMDEVVCARPLWFKSDWNIIQDNNPPHSLVLRWFDGNSISSTADEMVLTKNQMDGIITLPVEITYISKRLDREKKLDSLLSL
jgi:hypothetical protein